MKIFVVIIGVFILLLTGEVFAKTDLSKLAGKMIYRDVPAQMEFSERLVCRMDYVLRSNIRLYEENVDSTNENFRNIDVAFKRLRDYFARVQ